MIATHPFHRFSEHKGFAALIKGCFGAIRNPLAHEPKILWDGEDDAADYLTLISMLHRKLDNYNILWNKACVSKVFTTNVHFSQRHPAWTTADVGPGYRAYYAKTGSAVILLLCGGDKRKQDSDIDKACKFWNDWKQRHKKEEGQ